MNSFEPRPQDDGIDSLLTEFFRAEMPEEKLRELERNLPGRPIVVAKRAETAGETPRPTTHWLRAAAGLTAAAVCVAALVFMPKADTPLASNSEQGRQSEETQSHVTAAPVNERPAPASSVSPEVPTAELAGSELAQLASPPEVIPSTGRRPRNTYDYRISEEFEPVVSSLHGTAKFEQRARVRTTNVTFFEPRTGSQVEMQLPEIEIEIVAATEPSR